jgi:hypothetical protein
VGRVNDPLEHEADRVADQVMRTPTAPVTSWATAPPIRRKCCDQCDTTKDAQRRSAGPGVPAPDAVADDLASPSGGETLPDTARSFMEHRFGRDLSAVRVHTDPKADSYARALEAQAFTSGNHIFFRSGRFDPHHDTGRHLLAHELAHTVQQGRGAPSIQRKTDAEWNAEAAKLEGEILKLPEYNKLSAGAKSAVSWIIAHARLKPVGDTKGQRLYYLNKLRVAITTPTYAGTTSGSGYRCSPDTEKKNREVVDKALATEKLWGGVYSDVDEKAVASGTHKVERTGEQGKKFYVDRTDPRNIRVQIKIRLIGKPAEVSQIKALEDAVERAISMTTKGYYVDIVFVDKSGPDVFEFTVKFCEWPNSGNWASSPVTLSHEVHHALGLDDRYDYIEAHAARQDFSVEMRLDWFMKQMNKVGGARDPYSKMATSSNPLLAEDVCAVAFPPGADRNKCIAARKDLDPAGVPSLP